MQRGILQVSLVVLLGASLAQGALLWDNGSYGADPDDGVATIVPAAAGYDTLGLVVAGYNTTAAQRNADDFVVPAGPGWDLNSLVVYAYQTGSVVNPFSRAYVGVYNADPSGSTDLNPIYGGTASLDPLTAPDRFLGQVDTLDDRGNNTRNIHAVTLDLSWVPDLAPGQYWIAWGLRGQADNSTVASLPVNPGSEFKTPNNGLAWGRSRHTPPGREDFWQFADGNIPSGGDPNSFETYEYAFLLDGTVLPEPAALSLLVLGALPLLRRRRR